MISSTIIGIDASRALRAKRTGTERYAWEIIKRIVNMPLKTKDPLVYKLYVDREPNDSIRRELSGIQWVVIPRARLWTHLGLSPELRQNPPDLFFEPAHVLPFSHPSRSVVTVHDLGYEYFPETRPLSQLLYLKLTTRWHTRAAKFILADSLSTKNDLVNLYNADAQKIRVVYPGISLSKFTHVKDPEILERTLQRLNIRTRFLLYVGTIHPRKNLERLIVAFSKIAVHDKEINLILAGNKEQAVNSYSQTIERLGLSDRVQMPGYVADEDLPALYSGASAFVFPSLFEGFGIPVLEAQACGTPVLTSNTSSLPEVAGNAALFVNPLSVDDITRGLQKLLGDKNLQDKLVYAGKENVKRFTWENSATGVLEVIEECLYS